MKVNIIAEIGINHNGSTEIAKQLIDVAATAGCDYVKFQKRDPDTCVPDKQKNIPRNTPWGEMTYLEYKHRIEFNRDQYDEIDSYCKYRNIKWFASVWDTPSADMMTRYGDVTKIPSALITNQSLRRHVANNYAGVIVSTGMSTESEIESCVEDVKPDVIMHTNSTYPAPHEDLNLNYIHWLKQKYPESDIGYSGHEYGLIPTFAAVACGATWIERHITLNHDMWGSDHSSSIEPAAVFKLVKGIRDLEKCFQHPAQSRIMFPTEATKRDTLRN